MRADGKKYTISIDIWIEPFLNGNGDLKFRGDAFKVTVTNWIWDKRIREAVEGNLKHVFASIGDTIGTKLSEGIRRAVGERGVSLLKGNKSLIFSYSCNSILDRVGYPNFNYTSFQLDNICGGIRLKGLSPRTASSDQVGDGIVKWPGRGSNNVKHSAVYHRPAMRQPP